MNFKRIYRNYLSYEQHFTGNYITFVIGQPTEIDSTTNFIAKPRLLLPRKRYTFLQRYDFATC